MTHDDQEWLDALAGRETAPSATAREARALRDALRAAPVQVIQLPDESREDALIARAVSEGVIAKPMKPRRWQSWPLPLAASVLLVVAAGIFVHLQPQTPIVRSDEDSVVRLESADPAALKQQILNELRAAGVSATGYEALGVQGIDADLPLPLTDAVRSVLAVHDIAAPRDGVLRIEIRSAR